MAAALALAAAMPGAAAALGFQRVAAEVATERFGPVVATLPNGRALIAGGLGPATVSRGAELFNPVTDATELLGTEELHPRYAAAGAVVAGGDVLIAGGVVGTEEAASAELFDPATDAFEVLGTELGVTRRGAVAATLPDGDALVLGGSHEGGPLRSAELYNPSNRRFEAIESEMTTARYWPVASTLPNGDVLIAGGAGESERLASAEVFNAATHRFEAVTATLAVPVVEAWVAPLADGALLSGGGESTAKPVGVAQVFSPIGGTFETLGAPLVLARNGAAATTLGDGQVLIVGGSVESGGPGIIEESVLTAPTAGAATVAAITTTTATLAGSALSEVPGSTHFEYGTGTSYGANTAHQALAASLAEAGFSAVIGSLAPDTTYHYRLVAESAGGVSYGADQTFTTAQRSPTVTGLQESSSRWREGTVQPVISRRRHHRRAPLGTTFTLSLNEPSTVTMTFHETVSGHRVRGRCVIAHRKHRKGPACKRGLIGGRLTFNGHRGANRVAFQGAVSATKTLSPGHYTLVVKATDSAGISNALSIGFTIVR
jgi:hypothetical protein